VSDGLNNGGTRRRGAGRPFQIGEGGRPKGARNKRAVLAEQITTAEFDGVVQSVVQAALGGDMQAARIIMERLWPVRKGQPVTFDLPDDLDMAGLSEAFDAVLRATAKGELSPEEATTVAGLIEQRTRVGKLAEIEAMLEEIEESDAFKRRRPWHQ
jgi:hypothetical protein